MLQQFIDKHVKDAHKTFLGRIINQQRNGNTFLFEDESRAKVEVIVLTKTIFRIRLAPNGRFLPDFSYAISPNFKPENVEVQYSTWLDSCTIATEKVAFEINLKTGLMRFADKATGITTNEDKQSLHWEEHKAHGGYYAYATKRMQNEEAFFGLGDKPLALNLAGQRVTNWCSDMYAYERGRNPLYKAIPFYVGLHHQIAYGIFFDNTYQSTFDFGNEEKDGVSFWAEGGEMRYYYLHGVAVSDVIQNYAQLTGTHELPALWTLGFHQCRWSYFPESKVKDITTAFRNKQIPLDAIYLDIDYMDGYRCFTWNKNYFPEPQRLIAALNQQGIKTVVIIDPGIKIDDEYPVFQEALQKGYFCRRGDDYYMEGSVWPGRCYFPDFTHPEVRNWWGTLFKELLEQGVAGVWNDMNEPAVFETGTFPDDVRHNFDGYGGSHRKAHNVYGSQMVRATYEGMKQLQPHKRTFTITRAGYAGFQRYSSTWTGDNVANWDHLLLTIQMCVRLNMSGISFCGADLGGFTGGDPDGELYVRWLQVGVFSPFMRVHSAGDTGNREPWAFGSFYEKLAKKAIEMRYQFLGYIYTQYWLHQQKGLPILRHMAMMEQTNKANIARDDQFFVGENLLIAPIVTEGATQRKVYLPQGNWYNYHTKQHVEGSREHTVDAPLHIVPIFAKAGTVLPIYPIVPSSAYLPQQLAQQNYLDLYVFAGECNTVFYEDEGEGYGYLQQNFSEKTFITQQPTNAKLLVQQQQKGYYNTPYSYYKLHLVGFENVKSIQADGTQVAFEVENEVIICHVAKSFQQIIVA